MRIIKFIRYVFSKEGTAFDRWLDKKLNAYGWRGFVAGLIYLGIGYIIMYYSREISTFLGGTINENDNLNYEARMHLVNIGACLILFLMIVKLINHYSKAGRKAYQEKLRKDALMEAEILERKKEMQHE